CFVLAARPRPVLGPGRIGARLCSATKAAGVLWNATNRNASPSYSNKLPKLAPQMRVAFSSIAWNTGSQLAGRAADDLQHLGGRGLLLQCLGEIVGALAQFVKQAGVLVGDHGLAGEILDQLDLLVGERLSLLAIDIDSADQTVLLQHRHREDGAIAPELDAHDESRIALDVGLLRRNVRNVGRPLSGG